VPKKPASLKFDPQIYSQSTLNDLVVYAVYTLHRQGTEIASEDMVAACFVLFPKRFSLQKYPQWPDSAMVSRRWSDCKSKGYIKGNAAKGFQITARGIKHAEKFEKSLGKPLKPPRPAPTPASTKQASASAPAVHPELKAHAKKYVRSIEMSDAYKHFKKGTPLNEFDFRSMLLCTMESPPTTLARNLNQFKEYVNIHKREDLLSFLEFCENKFSSLLGVTSQQVEKKSSKTKK
jgi:hypothetical protein